MSNGTRKMGDYGGVGTKNWYSAINRQLGSQLPGGSGSVDTTRKQLDDAVKMKKVEQVKQDLKAGPVSEPSTGSNAAGLASQFVDSSSEGGAGVQSGLMAASMTSNPFIIGGAALMGVLGASQKRKSARREGLAKAQLGREQAMSTARSNFADSMQNILISRRKE